MADGHSVKGRKIDLASRAMQRASTMRRFHSSAGSGSRV